MGALLGFAVGYVLGARAGSDRFDEVLRAVEALRSSQEFTTLRTVLQDHVRGTVSRVLDGIAPPPGRG